MPRLSNCSPSRHRHFIADDGTIRQIAKPTEFFLFKATNNPRYNEVRKEALNEAVRGALIKRARKEGLQMVHLPQFTTERPTEAHVSIFTTPPKLLCQRKGVIVIVNEDVQDLGVFAWRKIGSETGLNGSGSILGIVKELNKRFTNPVNGSWPVNPASSAGSEGTVKAEKPTEADEAAQVAKDLQDIQYPDIPGLIVLNPGQLLYSPRENKAMNRITWVDRPRKSALHPMSPVDERWNTIPGHENAAQHIKWVFNRITTDSNWVSPKAEIYVIALNNGAQHVLQLLNDECERRLPDSVLLQQLSALSLRHTNFSLDLNAWKLTSHVHRAKIQSPHYRASHNPKLQSRPRRLKPRPPHIPPSPLPRLAKLLRASKQAHRSTHRSQQPHHPSALSHGHRRIRLRPP